MEPNDVRYKEVVLGVFKNHEVPTLENGSIVYRTVEFLLNERLRTLEAFSNTENPLGVLLSQDKLACVWFPNDYIYSFGSEEFQNFMPVIWSENNAHRMFVGPDMSTLEDNYEIIGLHISEAQVYKLYNASTKTYLDGDTPFKEMHGFDPNDCPQVSTLLANLPGYELAPQYKLVHLVDDIQNVYIENCINPEMPAGVGDRTNSGHECPRASYELKLKGDYDYHANYFVGFRLNNLAAFDQINAHPCNKWSGNGVRAFQFNWLVAINGVVQDKPNDYIAHCYSSQLVKTTVSYSYVWVTVTIPIVGPVLVHVKKKKNETRELLAYRLPETSLFPVFAYSAIDNHWKPDMNGDIVWFDAVLVHFGPCAATNNVVTTHQYQIGGKFDFKIPYLNPGTGNINFQVTNTTQKTVSYQMNAGATYHLGNTKLEYCHPYASPHRWHQFSSTGTVTFEFWAPWYN